jgi:hypothetical protein
VRKSSLPRSAPFQSHISVDVPDDVTERPYFAGQGVGLLQFIRCGTELAFQKIACSKNPHKIRL